MGRGKQRKIVDVESGLFLIRYATAEDDNEPPKISLAPDGGSNRVLQLITPPGESDPTLWRPGACIVLRASAPGKLVVEVEPQPGSRSASSSVRVEPLFCGRANEAPKALDRNARLDLAGFHVTGHVAGLGDVRVRADEWLAGPSAPSRIEGITIEWDSKPAGLDLRYSVSTARPQAISKRLVEVGEFAGTRGKALPLVAVAFELTGEAASKVQLTAEATFLGSPATRGSGRRVFLTGPTGREPLVGLKLTAQTVGDRPIAKSVEKQDDMGRVRVFRGRSKSSPSEVLRERSTGTG